MKFLRVSRQMASLLFAMFLLTPLQIARADQWVGFDFSRYPNAVGKQTSFWLEPNSPPLSPTPGGDKWEGYFYSGGNYRFELSPYIGPGLWLASPGAPFGTFELGLDHNAGPYPFYRVAEIRFDWKGVATKYGDIPTIHLTAAGVTEVTQLGVCDGLGQCGGSFDAKVGDIGGRLWVENWFSNPELGGAVVNMGFFAVSNLEYRLVPTAIPEPGTYSMVLVGLGLLAIAVRRGRRF